MPPANTCELCRAGYQSSCVNREPMNPLGAQAELLRVPLADGTLVATNQLGAERIIAMSRHEPRAQRTNRG
jgi:hypothetical protein